MKKSRLLLLFLTLFLVMLGFGMIIPNLAYYADDIDASPTEIAVLMSIYSGMQLVFAPIWGRLSDKHGRKPAILLGLFGNAIALIGFGLADSYIWLLITRSAAGIASAAILPSARAYVADITTEEERGRGMGLMGAATGLGFILGPAIGGILVYESASAPIIWGHTIGKHSMPFLVAGGLSIVNFLFALTLLPESVQKDADPEVPENRQEWISPRQIFSQATLKSSLTPLFLIAFFSTFGFAGLEMTFPLFIKEEFGYGARDMGWMFMGMGLISVPLQGGLLGRLINRIGERRIILFGLLLCATGIGLLLIADNITVVVYLIIAGVGSQLIRPTNASWVSKKTRIGQGTAIGIMDAFLSLGRILGPLLAGWLYAKNLDYPYQMIPIVLILTIVCLYIPLRRIERED